MWRAWPTTAMKIATIATMARTAAQPSPTSNSARTITSSLVKRLNGGRPKSATSPTPKIPPRAGRRARSARTPSISARALGGHDLARGEEQHALGQPVAEDVEEDGGDGEPDAGRRAESDEPHVLDAGVGEHPLVVALGHEQRRGHGQRQERDDHEQGAGEAGPDGKSVTALKRKMA